MWMGLETTGVIEPVRGSKSSLRVRHSGTVTHRDILRLRPWEEVTPLRGVLQDLYSPLPADTVE